MAPQHRLYSHEIAETILERLADGEPLRVICESDGMPSRGAVQGWVLSDHEGFASRYARARECGLELMADDILHIADGAQDSDSASAARVKCDQRRWLMSKLIPRTYGDRLDLNHSGEMAVKAIPDDKLESRLSDLLRKAGTIDASGRAGAAPEPAKD